MIELRNLNKTFHTQDGALTALDDINLTVQDGEIFGIIGLSGAGKSTLVRCMNLLERPTHGEVLVDGQDLMKLSPAGLREVRRNIGMIFQSYNLLEQRTVLRNVLYPLELTHEDRRTARTRAMQLLELVGLADRASAYPAQLSGGQKQRVAIARALATNPHYLLCDEATSALDPTTTDSILALLQTINRTLGVTVVVITHEMAVVDRICHRVAVIDNSRIVEMGAVDAIFANPRSAIARELILPHVKVAATVRGGAHVRLAFNGESTYKPLVSALILETGVPVSILFADTRDIGGKTYGQILLELPGEDRLAQRVTAWLDANFPSYSLEV
ncbi:MAG: ATP-binding cassette domain-containing protein [Clostridiales bacterium]|nr:ATP-binding cassette domain-containing protein [Clostridiales bacterium]PWM36755.1 MAG: ABC transporter [Oscillospiraceae bacterium]